MVFHMQSGAERFLLVVVRKWLKQCLINTHLMHDPSIDCYAIEKDEMTRELLFHWLECLVVLMQ